MNITKKEFTEHLKTISKYAQSMLTYYPLNMALPEIAKNIAAHCFREMIDESCATSLLRQYMNELKIEGFVNFLE